MTTPHQDVAPRLSSGDRTLVDILRLEDGVGIDDLSKALGVTATAVRQRLDRLIDGGLVERSTAASVTRQRGRPAHVFKLTPKGIRSGGDNFRDLALVLWRHLRNAADPAVRQGLLRRVGSGLADSYRMGVAAAEVGGRLREVAEILRARDISCGVEEHDGLHVLTTYGCPYPVLAEEDRAICAAERLMLQDLVGSAVSLSECRLDGANCCRFTVKPAAEPVPEPHDAAPADPDPHP